MGYRAMLSIFLMALLGGTPPQTRVHVERVAGWRIEVEADIFNGRTRCAVTTRDMSLSPSDLMISLGNHVDTSTAVIRLDSGPPVTLHAPEVADLSAKSDAALFNPSGGKLVEPLAELKGAKKIYIETDPRRPLILLNVASVPAVLAAASKAGCEGYVTP